MTYEARTVSSLETVFENVPRPKGLPKSGGRQKGTVNRRTRERQAAVVASGLLPVPFLLSLVENEALDLPTRLEAAKSAAPYIHPKLQVVDSTIRAEVTTTA
jgi:hypothetical protein